MGAEDYEEADYEFIREAIFPTGWAPSPAPGTWLGIVPENARIDPDPTPTGRMEAPAIYGAWKIEYDELVPDYGGTRAPARFGRLVVAGYLEKGARKGFLRQLRRAVLAQALTAPDEPLGFDVQEAKTTTVGYVGPWFVETLTIPFCGG